MLHTTRWSLVVAARGNDQQARAALAELCQAYRGAVLAYARRHCGGDDEAEDLTQAFFVEFLEHALYASADPQRGHFRSYLFTALSRFIRHAQVRDATQKRGGGQSFVALDSVLAEALPDADGATPDAVFEREWAQAVLAQALRALEREAAQAHREVLFVRLRAFLLEPPASAAYRSLEKELGVRANTLAAAVHRWRERLRELVREELSRTVLDAAAVDVELRALRHALRAA